MEDVQLVANTGLKILEPLKPTKFVFYMPHNDSKDMASKMLFTIHPDGTIERGPAFTTEDAASLRFWEIMEQMGVVKYKKEKE